MIDLGSIGTLMSGASAVGSGIASLFGGGGEGEQSEGGNKEMWWAMSQTSDAVQRALQGYQDHLESAQQHLMPYYQAGTQGLNALSAALTPTGGLSQVDMVSGLPPGAGADLMNYLTQTPAYQFPLQEGINALDRTAASKGMLLSGAQQKGINQYGQNFALSNALGPAMANYQAYLKNIAGLTNIGQTTANTLGGYQMQTGQLKGAANLAQAQMQNALAGGMSTANAASDRQNYLQSLTEPNIGSTLGAVAGLDWNQIGKALGNVFGIGSQGIGSSYAGANATGSLTYS